MASKETRRHFSVTQVEFYEDYVKDCKETGRTPVSKKTHRKLMYQLYDRIGTFVLDGNVFVMPQNLGTLSITVHTAPRAFIDYDKFRETREIEKKPIPFQGGTFFRWKWAKSGFFTNSGVYKFKRASRRESEEKFAPVRTLFRKIVDISRQGKTYPRR